MSSRGDREATEAERLVRQIAPLLYGKNRMLQSAVIADLLATWLAGHFAPGDRKRTQTLRKQLLRDHLALVHDLLPFNERELEARRKAGAEEQKL